MKESDALVQELVCHHQGRHCYAKLASWETSGEAIAFLETPNVVQRKDDDRLADLCGLEQFLHEVDKRGRGVELQGRGSAGGLGRVGGRGHVRSMAGRRWGGGEPEVADHLAGLFCDEAGWTFEGGIEPVDEMGRVDVRLGRVLWWRDWAQVCDWGEGGNARARLGEESWECSGHGRCGEGKGGTERRVESHCSLWGDDAP